MPGEGDLGEDEVEALFRAVDGVVAQREGAGVTSGGFLPKAIVQNCRGSGKVLLSSLQEHLRLTHETSGSAMCDLLDSV